jgi:hypothetical protein
VGTPQPPLSHCVQQQHTPAGTVAQHHPLTAAAGSIDQLLQPQAHGLYAVTGVLLIVSTWTSTARLRHLAESAVDLIRHGLGSLQCG